MADLSIGDKVKFLNQKGGGVVVKVIDPKMVLVSDDDGFEFPVLMNELVQVDPSNAGGRFFDEHFRTSGKKAPEEEQGDKDPRASDLPQSLTSVRRSEEIFLAFVPNDQKWLITGQIDVLIINNSSYDLLYNLFHKTPLGHYEGVDYGSVFADSRLLIATVNRENLARWSDGYLQFLFHKGQSPAVLPPFNSEFRIEGKKFFKEGNYRESLMVGGKAIVVKIVALDQYIASEGKGIPEKQALKEAPVVNTPLIMKHMTASREAEVDLHIHELLDDPSNLEKAEILDYQKEYFLRCLDSAIANGFLKLTVIHGVGNGIFRTVVLDLLKNYRGTEILDAPMSKYGVGAIEIRIPHNRD
jgi:hypothetical protein